MASPGPDTFELTATIYAAVTEIVNMDRRRRLVERIKRDGGEGSMSRSLACATLPARVFTNDARAPRERKSLPGRQPHAKGAVVWVSSWPTHTNPLSALTR